LSIAVLACAVQTAAYLTNELMLDGRYHQLNVAADRTVFGWANTFAIVLLAVLVALVAGRRLTRPWHAAVLVLGLGLLAVDDATGTHDRLRDLRVESIPGPSEAPAAIALVAFAALLAVVFLVLWTESGQVSADARRLIRVGLLALASAVLLRVIGAAFARETFGESVRALGVAVEQGLDFVGWIMVATGFAVALRDSAPSYSSSPPPHWPALIASLAENPRPASITAPTLPPGAAKTRRFSR